MVRPGLAGLGQFLQRRISQPLAQVPEGILVRHQFDSQAAAMRIQLPDLRRRERAPVLPHRLIPAIGERVLRIELEFVDFEIREMRGQFHEGFQPRHPSARNVQHHAALREISVVADFQAGQLAAELAQQLAQGRDRGVQSLPGTKLDFDSFGIEISAGPPRRGLAANRTNCRRGRFRMRGRNAQVNTLFPRSRLQSSDDRLCDRFRFQPGVQP